MNSQFQENAAIVNDRLERFRCSLHGDVIGKGEGGWDQEKLREKRGDSPAQLRPLCRQIQMKILGKLEGCFCGLQMYMT